MPRKRKKKQGLNLLDIYKSIRKTWNINPKTKVKDKKRKSRQQEKVDLKKEW